MERTCLILSVFILLASCVRPDTGRDGAGFNGRWNIAAGDRAWWLEVSRAGTPELRGRFVGAPGGGMYEIPVMVISGGDLVFSFPDREYDDQGNRGVYRAHLEDGKLAGHLEVEGRPDMRREFTGERAPVVSDIDDGTWLEGEPVELLNGEDISGWEPGGQRGWSVVDGILTNEPRAGNLVSTEKFWNFRLHAEYRLPEHSNSGIGLRGRYEVQIVDDYGREPDTHSHGSIYSRIAPASNQSRPPGEWQTLDVTLIGRHATVAVNGVTVIENGEIEGLTALAHDPHEDSPGPISVQGDHQTIEIRKLTVTPLER